MHILNTWKKPPTWKQSYFTAGTKTHFQFPSSLYEGSRQFPWVIKIKWEVNEKASQCQTKLIYYIKVFPSKVIMLIFVPPWYELTNSSAVEIRSCNHKNSQPFPLGNYSRISSILKWCFSNPNNKADGPNIHSAITATTHVWYMLCAVMLPSWWITPCNISLVWTNEATLLRSPIINTIWSTILVFSVVWERSLIVALRTYCHIGDYQHDCSTIFVFLVVAKTSHVETLRMCFHYFMGF